MAKVTLFEAEKGSVTLLDGDNYIIVRDGLTPKQAASMAARLNREVSESDKILKPTRREQKFMVHADVDVEFTTMEDADEFDGFYSAKEVETQVKEYLQNFDELEGEYDEPVVKVKVTKVYDKQVPNE
jgi:hypothetical protein